MAAKTAAVVAMAANEAGRVAVPAAAAVGRDCGNGTTRKLRSIEGYI